MMIRNRSKSDVHLTVHKNFRMKLIERYNIGIHKYVQDILFPIVTEIIEPRRLIGIKELRRGLKNLENNELFWEDTYSGCSSILYKSEFIKFDQLHHNHVKIKKKCSII